MIRAQGEDETWTLKTASMRLRALAMSTAPAPIAASETLWKAFLPSKCRSSFLGGRTVVGHLQ